jgi:4-amino-4-deoxy-L-arabinose transferase-like glycosyltransferase
LAVLLVAFAVVRMATTFRVFSATIDEGTHTAAALDLYQFHHYLAQRENPPISRVVNGLAPYLGGMRFHPERPWPQQLAVLIDEHKYERNLFLVRLGNLLFFVLASFGVWLLARRDLGGDGALLAVLLFTMEPIVLGYSALATVDIASVAGLVFALLAFRRWLDVGSLERALVLGFAAGFAILCKFSNIGYVPAACLGMFLVRVISGGLRPPVQPAGGRRYLALIPAFGVMLLTIWAGYAFTMRPLGELGRFTQAFGPRMAEVLAHIDPATRIPAPDLFAGIALLLMVSHGQISSYLWGQSSVTGWWWYFPFAMALKTTLAFLAMVVAGAWLTRGPRRRIWLEWVAAIVAIVAVAMTSPLDIGVRYVLAAYAPMAIAAAATLQAMLQGSRRLRATAVLMLALQIVPSLLAHPDYFPYFNLLAGREPGRYLVDSNLDWGQDVLRLRRATRELRIQSLSVSLMAPTDFGPLGFPPTHPADPWRPTHGWLAVSESSYRVARIQGGWQWLPPQPTRWIGKSIRLYSIP